MSSSFFLNMQFRYNVELRFIKFLLYYSCFWHLSNDWNSPCPNVWKKPKTISCYRFFLCFWVETGTILDMKTWTIQTSLAEMELAAILDMKRKILTGCLISLNKVHDSCICFPHYCFDLALSTVRLVYIQEICFRC